MVKIEEMVQKINNFIKKVNSLDKIVDYINEEVTPKLFKGNTDKIYELNKKIIDELIHRL